MTISYAHDFTDISSCDLTTSGGTHYRLNGVNSGNPLAEADAYVQGTGCIANKCGATTGAVDTGGHFNHTTTFDLTNKHLFVWRMTATPGNMLTKANAGIAIGLTNTSTTSTAAWSTTNYKKWNVDGSDTQPNSDGWKCYVIDPSGTADLSAGALTLSTVKNVGYLSRQSTGVSTALNNTFVDAMRAGTGITVTTTSGADVVTMAALYAYDSTKANSWGVVTQSSGIYYGAGKITLGAAAQAQVCNFTDTNQVFVWRDFPVSDLLYEFKLLGSASFKTTMQWTGSVIRGQTGQVWNITCDANSNFKGYACSFANIRSAVLSSGSVLDGCSVSSSGTIDANGAAIIGCSFVGHIASQLKVDAPAEMDVVSACSFSSGGTGHAIELTLAGAYTFNEINFTGYAGANGSTGNEAVFVNVATGSVTIYASSAFSYRTAGATVTVIAGAVTATLTVATALGSAIQSAQVMVAASSAAGDLPYQEAATIVNAGTTATVTHTAHGMLTNDKVLIKGASHYQNNGVFSITVTSANAYAYTLASAPGSNPTGAITATWVALSGLTDVNGQISVSRVFAVDQPVSGWARKSSASPYYRTGPVSGIIDSATGASLSALLIADE